MQDISSRENVIILVDSFYNKVLSDETIGHFFTKIVDLDLQKHMPIMYDFWESLLLGGRSYAGNPMEKHIDLNRKSSMEKAHFERWTSLWLETVDELYKGEIADQAKARALSIAQLMQFKVGTSN